MGLRDVAFDCPAYAVVKHEPASYGDAKGYVRLKHNDYLGLLKNFRNGGGQYADKFKVGSVMGYAMENYEDPDKARERNRANGGADHWINGCGVSITAHARAKEILILVEVGMKIWIEGHKYEVVQAFNGNLDLKPIAA